MLMPYHPVMPLSVNCEKTRHHPIPISERGPLRDVHLDADGLHARLQHLRHLRRPQPPGKDSVQTVKSI